MNESGMGECTTELITLNPLKESNQMKIWAVEISAAQCLPEVGLKG